MPIVIMCTEADISTHKGASVTRSLSHFHGDILTPYYSAIFRAGKRLQVTTLLKHKLLSLFNHPLSYILMEKLWYHLIKTLRKWNVWSMPFSQRDQYFGKLVSKHYIREEPPKI